ncbi:MAG TPA: DUF5679 domain-containing protein [Candidatus Paceibacterota bacterium]|nr:DUF5679 domain-containing protein [Candidatus Paceibacterota bacterium]
MVEAYCVKCKKKGEMKNPEIVKTARGGFMAKGKCACGTSMCAMMSAEVAEKAIKSGAKKAY